MNSLFPFIDKVERLRESDPRMAQLIERFGYIERNTQRPLFGALVESIVSQQVASASAERVVHRIATATTEDITTATTHDITPAAIASLGTEGLKRCGVSARKAEWIMAAAERFAEGEFEEETLKGLSNEEVIEKANLKQTSLYTIASRLGLSAQDYIRHFIETERKGRGV